MNEKEKIEFYIAMCKCCLLAQALQDCPLCRFNIGLAERVKTIYSTPVPIAAQLTVFAVSEQI